MTPDAVLADRINLILYDVYTVDKSTTDTGPSQKWCMASKSIQDKCTWTQISSTIKSSYSWVP